MKWAELAVELIGYLAWPGAILTIVLIFRRQIGGLFKRVKKLSKGDLNIDFAADAIKKELETMPNFRDATPENFGGWPAYLDLLKSCGLWLYLHCLHLGQVSALSSLSKKDATAFALGRKYLTEMAVLLERQEPDSKFIQIFRGLDKDIADSLSQSATL